MPVLLLLGSGINQARIRRRIFRLKILDRFKVGRIGHDFGELLQLLELIQLCPFLVRDSSAHKNPPFGLDPKRTPRLKDRQLKNCRDQIFARSRAIRATTKVTAATKKSTIAPIASQIAGRTGATQTIVSQAQRMRNANKASDNARTEQNQAILRKYRRRGSSGICSMRDEMIKWINRVAKLRKIGLTRRRL